MAAPVFPTFGTPQPWDDDLLAYLNGMATATGASLGWSNGTDDTSAVNAILASGSRLVRAVPGQTYLFSTPPVIKANTILDMSGATWQMKASTNCNMINNTAVSTVQRVIAGSITTGTKTFTLTTGTASSADVGRTFVIAGAGANAGMFTLSAKVATFTDATHVILDTNASTTVAAASTNVYDRDANISIIGGTWDRGNANGGAGDAQHSIFLRRVDNLYIDIDKFVSTGIGPKYAVHPGDVNNFSIRVKQFDHVSDGVHVRGPARKGAIYGCGGTSSDDFIALGASDSSRISGGSGDINDVNIFDVRGSSLNTNCVKLYGNTGTKVTSVHMFGTRSTQAKPVTVGAGDITGAFFDDITIDGLTVDGSSAVLCNGPNTGGTLRISNMTCSDAVSTDVVRGVTVAASTVWDRIELHSTDLPNLNLVASGSSTINIDGTVTDLIVEDAVSVAAASNASVVQIGATGTVTRAWMKGGRHENGSSMVKTLAGSVLGTVWFNGCYLNNSAFIADLTGTTTVYLNGVVNVSPSSGSLISRAASSVKVYGEGNTIAGGQTVTAGAIVSCYTSDVPYSATTGAVPTLTAGAGAGTGPTISVVGNDRSGTITVTCGTTPSAATLVTLAFTRTLGAAIRHVQITPTTTKGAACNPFVTTKATTGFAIGAATAPTASDSLIFDYLVIA